MGAAGGVSGTIESGLLNMASVMALATVAEAHEKLLGTIELNISFLRPAVGSVTAIATVLRKGKTLGFVNCEIRDELGKTVASGRIVHAIKQGKLAEGTSGFLWADLKLLRQHYLDTARGEHPAWKMSPVLPLSQRGHVEFSLVCNAIMIGFCNWML